jgi:hypothetical protein
MQRVMERLIADRLRCAVPCARCRRHAAVCGVLRLGPPPRLLPLWRRPPGRSTPWQGTLAHWHAFGHLAREHGITEVDLEGVNSPQRGWFKLGFGGSLQTYHTLHWSRPQ